MNVSFRSSHEAGPCKQKSGWAPSHQSSYEACRVSITTLMPEMRRQLRSCKEELMIAVHHLHQKIASSCYYPEVQHDQTCVICIASDWSLGYITNIPQHSLLSKYLLWYFHQHGLTAAESQNKAVGPRALNYRYRPVPAHMFPCGSSRRPALRPLLIMRQHDAQLMQL